MKEYSITSNDAEQRLDRFLRKLFINASKSLIYKLNRKGKIKVINLEWKKTKQDNEYKIQAGEKVQIFLSDKEIQELSQKVENTAVLDSGQKLSKKDIVFEDKELLIVNKNPWLNVHPGDHKTKEVSLIEQVEDYYAGQLNSLTFKPSLIHRIDRDTSGIIMIAKQKHILTKLSGDFKKKNALQKSYFALVVGRLSRPSGTIKKNLLRIENAKNENKVQVADKWLEAITHYTLLDEYQVELPEGEQILSALEVRIETGRMHQIRVHMEYLGNPILGDKTYGDKRLNSYFEKNYGVNRQMLHAWKIEFFHPGRQKKMKLEAKLKKDMQNFISKLS